MRTTREYLEATLPHPHLQRYNALREAVDNRVPFSWVEGRQVCQAWAAYFAARSACFATREAWEQANRGTRRITA